MNLKKELKKLEEELLELDYETSIGTKGASDKAYLKAQEIEELKYLIDHD